MDWERNEPHENLNEYNRKRNFEKTAEPQGEAAESARQAIESETAAARSEAGLRFVIQHHKARKDHYDLRLEWAGSLLSWAVPKGPSFNPRDKRLAVQVEEHPLEYRNFEGTIPKGEYGGGVVMLWDEGDWEPYGNVKEGLREGALKFTLKGRRLKGKWALVRLKAKEGKGPENWLFLKEKDEFAGAGGGISEYVTSIRTGRTMMEIENGEDEKIVKNPFDKADAQLAKLVSTVPSGEDWLYELKYDGYRIVAYLKGSSVRLITRNGHDYTKRFRDAASALLDWAGGRAMILDGEMTVIDEAGKSDFQALQNDIKSSGGQKLTYIIFDLLALDGEDIRGRRLIERKELLEALMQNAPNHLYYSRHVSGNGKECFEASCKAGMEGIVGKKADSVYSGTRNGDWIKLKCEQRQEFVIGGFTLTDKKAKGVSALLLGVYEGDELIYAGRAGTGLSGSFQDMLSERFMKITQSGTHFKQEPKPRTNETITWLKPELVAEIKFAEWTKEGLLRQASFKGLRTDKDPREVKREKAKDEICKTSSAQRLEEPMKSSESKDLMIKGVRITSPDKLIFDDPAITKAEVIRYYAEVSERMLPYVSGRILSIVRCPKGISQTCFYKKHPGPDSRGIITVSVPNSDGETEEYFYIENAAGIISEAQMGTLEFHVWGSRADQLERPDMMVFDLDPDEGMDLARIRQGVRDVKSILAELSLNSYLKTSGGKGYHVVVPLQPAASWDVFHDFAKRVAEVMGMKWPDRYTSNIRKAKRADRIFIDWIRNGRGATSIAPYSLRARKGAGVSMPISWDELDQVSPDGITMADALMRIKGSDPWEDFFRNEQMIK
jgi:bifunctional non-homologous end joining protein LigD